MAAPARKLEFTANNGLATGTSTTMTFTLPAGLASGDTAIFCMQLNSGTATATPPDSSWQLLFGPVYNSNNFGTYVWVKDLAAGNSGATVTFTSTNALRLVGVGQVWTGTSAADILAGQHPAPTVVTASGTSQTAPSFTTARTNSGVCLIWCIRDTSADANVATISAPTGHTLGTSSATAFPAAPNFRLQPTYRTTTAAGTYGGQTVTASEAVNTTVYAIEVPEATAVVATPTGGLGDVGDSLLYQAGSDGQRQAFIAAGWPASDVRTDGVTGRPIPDGSVLPTASDVINTWRASGFDPATWVIALGSNNFGGTDAQWTTWIKEKIDQIAAGSRAHYTLYWVGLVLRRNPAPTAANQTEATVNRFQAVIDAPALKTYNPKVTFKPININALLHNGRDETGLWTTGTDGRHMTAPGYAIRNQLIAAAVTPDTGAPVASFTASATSGVAPLDVTFTDTSTGAPSSWSWSFGDGTTSTARNPTKTYAVGGTYTVSLTASNAGGFDATPATVTITVTDPPGTASEGLRGWINDGGTHVPLLAGSFNADGVYL